jgi:hypothetical protein
LKLERDEQLVFDDQQSPSGESLIHITIQRPGIVPGAE